VTLERFADYAGANKAYVRGKTFDGIDFLPIAADSAAETALRAGDIDFARIATASVGRFEGDSRFAVKSNSSLDYYFLSMNVQDRYLKDRNLRQAIRSAIDVPGIIAAAWDDRWARANAIIPKSMGLGDWAGAPRYDRNVDKAKRFLAASGLKGLTLRLATSNQEAEKTAAQIIQSNLKDIGIKVELSVQDTATLFAIPGGGGDGKKRQLIFGNYVSQPDPSWSTVWWTCAQMGEWNWANWCSMYVNMQKQWDEAAAMVWIAYPTYYSVTPKSIRPTLRPDGHRYFYAFTAV
jgi:peptide/nickel transport system substrate-binding protein